MRVVMYNQGRAQALLFISRIIMIELSKDEVTALLLEQEFYTYYEISDTKIKSKYLVVTRKVLKRDEGQSQ